MTGAVRQVDLHWTDNAATEVGFRIDRKQYGTTTWVYIGAAGANATGFSDNRNLLSFTRYTWQVIATSPWGSSAPISALMTTLPTPNVPQNVVAAALAAPVRVKVDWKDTSGNEQGFKVARSVDGGAFSPFRTLAPNVKTLTDQQVLAGHSYSYIVGSYNAWGKTDAPATTPVTP
jgi:hypothetical protein